MTGPGNELPERAGGRGHFRASQADRERTIDVLKIAFVEERLTKDEFDLRVDQVLASRTYAELTAVTSDLVVSPAAAGPVSTPGRTLAKAAWRAGICMLVAFVIAGAAVLINKEDMSVALALIAAVVAVIAASGFLGYGVIDAWHEHRSRSQLPPRPDRNSQGAGGKGLESGQPGRADHDQGLPWAQMACVFT